MIPTRALAAAIAATMLLLACGDDDDSDGGTATSTTEAETTTTVETRATTTSAPVELEQPAIWPAADVVFPTPEEAAADFVAQALGVPPVLGEFRQGDARSGEIEVLSAGEGDAAMAVARGLLLLRQLGPNDGWFVLAAVNDNASITSPESMTHVAAGPLSVEGMARGFEATVLVRAFVAGDAGAELDRVITQGGPFETPEPFTVSLDLSGAAPGDVVTLLVQGATGLETDPGDVAAIPVVIAS